MLHLKTFGFIILLMVEKIRMTPERYFVSNADFEMLLKTEEQLIKSLQKYVRTERKRLNFLEQYLNRSKLEYESAIKDVPYYLGNPINAYTLIKRLGPDLEFAENILKNKTELKTPEALFPTENDLTHSIKGLLTALVAYNVNVSQVANGIINGTASRSNEVYTETVTPMSENDCYTIGKYLLSKKVYQEAIPWLEEAYKKLEEKNNTELIVEVLDDIIKSYHYLEDLESFQVWALKRINLKPDDRVSQEIGRYVKSLQSRRRGEKSHQTEELHKRNHQEEEYWAICNGKVNHRLNINERLGCHYKYGQHPFFKLAPLKAEYVHRNPDVMMFYQVLSDDETEAVKELSKPVMWKNSVNDVKPPHKESTTNYEFIHLEDNSSAVVARISRRALMISGMGPEDEEPLRIVNYGIGGLTLGHWDTQPFNAKGNEKERSASILFYLSDVEQGGATVFPILGLAVFPVKGAALSWTTRLPSGQDDLFSLHGSCPVMRGDKWVAIKWPHQDVGKQCPIWTTEKGIVTEEILKELLEDHHYDYMQIAKKNNLLSPANYQKGDMGKRS